MIASILRDAMGKYHLNALIVRVTTAGKDTYTGAMGESMTGVPAQVDMHYLPDLPEADAVTIKMLANSTSGYADYVYQPSFTAALNQDPFRQWNTAELIRIGTSAPPTFPPGTNSAYSHTNYAILGAVLEKATRTPLSALMTKYVFDPLGLQHTHGSDAPLIPEPVLHTFSSERREVLGIPLATPFSEDTTYWNPSWTAPSGALQTTDVTDLTTSIAAIGSGQLLSPASHDAQVGPNLVGFGHPAPGCPACRPNTPEAAFGMAVILNGPWLTGNKFYAGGGAVVGYLPSDKLAIAVITTYQAAAFDAHGDAQDAGPAIMASLASALTPAHPIPGR